MTNPSSDARDLPVLNTLQTYDDVLLVRSRGQWRIISLEDAGQAQGVVAGVGVKHLTPNAFRHLFETGFHLLGYYEQQGGL